MIVIETAVLLTTIRPPWGFLEPRDLRASPALRVIGLLNPESVAKLFARNDTFRADSDNAHLLIRRATSENTHYRKQPHDHWSRNLSPRLSGRIPLTFCSPPIEPILVTGKGSTGKDQCEPSLGAWNVRHDTIDPGVGPRNERLLYQSTVRPCDLSSFSMRPDGQQQCVPFAFAAATTKAAEHWSGRFSEIKILQCPKWALRPFRFL